MQYLTDPNKPHLGGNILEGDPLTYFPALWKDLQNIYNVRKVLDVGCGAGYALEYFKNLGCQAIGLDGLDTNVEICQQKNLQCINHDLTTGPYIFQYVPDLVLCVEVLEHIEEKYVSNILDTICIGKILCITAAKPGQKGYHHVNCQPEQYWIDRICNRGYNYLKALTEAQRVINPEYFKSTGLLFEWVESK